MVHTNTIPLPNQVEAGSRHVSRNPTQSVQEAPRANAASLQGSRAPFNSGTTRRVRFAERAGAMDSAPKVSNERALRNLLEAHPTLDFWAYVGVPQGTKSKEVMRVYRERVRVLHPDKLGHLSSAEREAKTEEFKLLTAIRELLVDPITRGMYDEWRASLNTSRVRGRTPPSQSYEETRARYNTPPAPAAKSSSSTPYADYMEAEKRAGFQGAPSRSTNPQASSSWQNSGWNTTSPVSSASRESVPRERGGCTPAFPRSMECT